MSRGYMPGCCSDYSAADLAVSQARAEVEKTGREIKNEVKKEVFREIAELLIYGGTEKKPEKEPEAKGKCRRCEARRTFARWEKAGKVSGKCSMCKATGKQYFNFCPNCGSYMKESV